MRKCGYDGCNNKHLAKDMCSSHYGYWYKNGRDMTGYEDITFRRKIDKTVDDVLVGRLQEIELDDECWEWPGTITRGYGIIKCRERGQPQKQYAHRISYKYFIGKLDKNLVLDHLCENKRCVNPFHLEQVTSSENVKRASRNKIYLRGYDSDRYCINGHAYGNEGPTYYQTKNGVQKVCRVCNTISSLKYRAKRNMENGG